MKKMKIIIPIIILICVVLIYKLFINRSNPNKPGTLDEAEYAEVVNTINTYFAPPSYENINLDSYQGTWVSFHGNEKLIIEQNQMTLKSSLGQETVTFEVSEQGRHSIHTHIGEYYEFYIEGKELKAAIMMLDAPTTYAYFVKEGHENDFVVNVYPETKEEIKECEIQDLILRIDECNEYAKKYPEIKKFKNVDKIRVKASPYKESLAVYIQLENDDYDSLIEENRSYFILDQDTYHQIRDLLTNPELLSQNPYQDMDGMSRSYEMNELYVTFKSNEKINIQSNHGFIYNKDTAYQIVNLLLKRR